MLLYSYFLKLFGCLCSVEILEAEESFPWWTLRAPQQNRNPQCSNSEQDPFMRLQGTAGYGRVRQGLQGKPTKLLTKFLCGWASSYWLITFIFSYQQYISLYTELLLYKFKINVHSKSLSRFCLPLLSHTVWQTELREEPLSDPVTWIFY